MKFLRKYADNTRRNSIVNKWRRKRFLIFKELAKDLQRPLKILDAGGTENFWVQMNYTDPAEAHITILNTAPVYTTYNNIIYVNGDARDLSRFGDKEFDVVFSNSAIEHVGGLVDQEKMAGEVTRVGKKIYIQTPNYYFPIEPHFLLPFFQFLPQKAQILLLRNLDLGWFKKCNSEKEAIEALRSVRLLKKKELAKIFPYSKILKEKFIFLTKSFIVVH